MSLQYWFPLTKDYKNYGLHQDFVLPSTLNEISLVAGGKTGTSCFSNTDTATNKFSNGSTSFSIASLSGVSIAMWIYYISSANTYNYILQFNTSASTSYANTVLGLSIDSNGLKFLLGGVNTYITNQLEVNAWNHLAVTWSNNTTSFYLNGSLIDTKSRTKGSATEAAAFSIGTNKGATNGIEAKFNDVRVYDHCLSPKEVEEISKGLFLHYKFNKMETKNYLIPPYDRSDKYNTTGVVSSTSTNHYTNIITTARIDPLPGPGIYTYSAYIYNTSNANICVSCRLWNSNGEAVGSWVYGNYILSGEEGLSTVTIDGTALADVVSAQGRLYYSKSLADMTSEFSYQYLKFEQSPFYTYWTPYEKVPSLITYDCSGFSHNGTATQSLPIIKNSPRYDAALKFDGTSYVSCVSPCAEARTVSFWVNFDSVPSGATSIFMDYKSKIGFGISNSQNFICSTRGLSSKMFSKPELSANTWYHFVIVAPNGADDTARQLYINGIEQTPISSSSYWTYSIDQLQVGKRSSSSDGFVGKISDVRVYAAALTAAAVKELYNTSMQVDASGNVYARELVQL